MEEVEAELMELLDQVEDKYIDVEAKEIIDEVESKDE